MRSILTVCLVAGSVLGGTACGADTKAEIVSTAMIWNGATRNTDPDLIRFGDRWFLACLENKVVNWTGGKIRVVTSADGKTWESAALIESPTPTRGLHAPTFTITPGGQLMLSALGGLPYPENPVLGPSDSGLMKTIVWYSKDGRDWGKPTPVGLDNFPFSRVVWHKGTAYSHAFGRICGIATTIQIMASKDGKAFESRYEETLKTLMPYEGELFFEGDVAYCLTTGYSTTGPTAVLGTAKAPYKAWQWKVLDQQVRLPKFLRLPDKRVIATVGLYEQKKFRTALCEFHPATGKFTELLELSTAELPVTTGLAWDDGHLWVSHPVEDKAGVRIHLAKVKLR